MTPKIQNLDFSRHFLMNTRNIDVAKSVLPIIEHVKAAEKFILPVGGVLIEDLKLKAIDEKLRLSLPFETITLEWAGNNHNKKNILVLRQLDDDIELQPLMWDSRTGKWGWQPQIYINRDKYIEREESGRIAYFMRYTNQAEKAYGNSTQVYYPFLHTFLSFINVMSCKNIERERSVPGAVRLARRGPIPYDSYNILTIGGGHAISSGKRSNGGLHREEGRIHSRARSHLRMGHIVRGKTGAYWRNAHTVCADSEFSITKVYKVKGHTG